MARQGEPYYYQGFESATMAMDVGTAVDTVLAKELAGLRERTSGMGLDLDAIVREGVDAGDIDPTMAPRHVTDVSGRTAQQEIERLARRHATYVKALKLVINALCYLTAYPDDSATEYPPEAPRELVAATTSSDARTASKARSRLLDLGYIPVHLCGRALVDPVTGHDRGDRHVHAHWRRGHWRRQAYGEGRSLRKLIWVMPTVVGSGQGEPPGHVYLVS